MKGDLFKCEVCGNVVSKVETGVGTLSCCNQAMKQLEVIEVKQEGLEKHKPVIEIAGDKVVIKVGSILHPMTDEHHISLIQLIQNGKVVAGKKLYPGDEPIATFYLENTENLEARAFCNLHGFWKN